jgi:hypothetical protein
VGLNKFDFSTTGCLKFKLAYRLTSVFWSKAHCL